MDQGDHRRLDNAEDGTRQDRRNPFLECHSTLLKRQEISGLQRDGYDAYYMFAMTVVPTGMKNSR